MCNFNVFTKSNDKAMCLYVCMNKNVYVYVNANVYVSENMCISVIMKVLIWV